MRTGARLIKSEGDIRSFINGHKCLSGYDPLCLLCECKKGLLDVFVQFPWRPKVEAENPSHLSELQIPDSGMVLYSEKIRIQIAFLLSLLNLTQI